jgi:poly-gamma-glutamate synthesis protein (capsule biosynthesis protein)
MFTPIKTLLFVLFCPICLLGQDTLSLMFTGDIMGHQAQIISARTGWGRYDYKPCFQYVKPILENVDLAVGNLEVTLPGRWPYTGFVAAPIFRSPDALAEALKDAGFDFLMTANNHANDSQRRGIRHTIETLHRLEFLQTGTFKNAAARAVSFPLMVRKKGFTLAFLNYTFVGTNGIPTLSPTVVNILDTVQIQQDFIAARNQHPDFIIAIVHWGKEHYLETSEDQLWQAEFLARQGVDIIIGMHPHVVQPIHRIEVTSLDGACHEALVAFSLGNFISNHHKPNTDGGLMLRLDLVRKAEGEKAMLGSYGHLPVWRYINKSPAGKKTFMVLPVAHLEENPTRYPTLNDSARKAMQAFATGIRKRLTCPEWVKK